MYCEQATKRLPVTCLHFDMLHEVMQCAFILSIKLSLTVSVVYFFLNNIHKLKLNKITRSINNTHDVRFKLHCFGM